MDDQYQKHCADCAIFKLFLIRKMSYASTKKHDLLLDLEVCNSVLKPMFVVDLIPTLGFLRVLNSWICNNWKLY